MSNQSNDSINKLLELGAKGQFPIFHPSWISEISNICDDIPKCDNELITKVIKQLERHKSFKRKMTVLISLPKEERNQFIKDFLKKVERKVLNNSPEIH